MSPISSTVPAAVPTSTWSPRRSGWVKAIRIPAIAFESVDWAAKPRMRAITADEARIEPATAWTSGITRSAERTPTMTTPTTTVRRMTL